MTPSSAFTLETISHAVIYARINKRRLLQIVVDGWWSERKSNITFNVRIGYRGLLCKYFNTNVTNIMHLFICPFSCRNGSMLSDIDKF